MLYNLNCGHTTNVNTKSSHSELFCETCKRYRTIQEISIESNKPQFRTRIEPDEKRGDNKIHAIEVWFEADHIMDAFDCVNELLESLGLTYAEVKQVIEVKSR